MRFRLDGHRCLTEPAPAEKLDVGGSRRTTAAGRMRLSDGTDRARDGQRRRASVQRPLACPLVELDAGQRMEPRLFSFNPPVGACPILRRRLGQNRGVRPCRARSGVAFPSLEPGQRRGQGWDRRKFACPTTT